MPVVGPRIAVAVQQMGSVGLVTIRNRTGHLVHLTVEGDEGGPRVVRVAGNDTLRTVLTVPKGERVQVRDAQGDTLYPEPTEE